MSGVRLSFADLSRMDGGGEAGSASRNSPGGCTVASVPGRHSTFVHALLGGAVAALAICLLCAPAWARVQFGIEGGLNESEVSRRPLGDFAPAPRLQAAGTIGALARIPLR